MVTQETMTAEAELVSGLKTAMRGFAQSVVIITTLDDDGGRYAMAATAVTPVSMDPPSMLICVNKTAASHQILHGGASFCLNILGAHQLDVGKCNAMSKGDDRFSVGDWQADAEGLPYLQDAQAVIFCEQKQAISYGSHDIFIGNVKMVKLAGSVDPLIYLDGAYRTIGAAL